MIRSHSLASNGVYELERVAYTFAGVMKDYTGTACGIRGTKLPPLLFTFLAFMLLTFCYTYTAKTRPPFATFFAKLRYTAKNYTA